MRPDEHEQLAPSSALASACGQKKGKRGRVEERHSAQINDDAAHSGVRDVTTKHGEKDAVPMPFLDGLGFDGLWKRTLNLRRAVQIELAGETRTVVPPARCCKVSAKSGARTRCASTSFVPTRFTITIPLPLGSLAVIGLVLLSSETCNAT
jgi:hypothetical protein